MAEFIYSMSDEQVTILADAFAQQYGYQATVEGKPNPQSKLDFALDKVRGYVKEVIKAHVIHETDRAIADTKAAAIAQVEAFEIQLETK